MSRHYGEPSGGPQGLLDWEAPNIALETKLDREFNEWLETPYGRSIASEAEKRALALYRRGSRHFGIGAIWESIRFDWTVRGDPDAEFKVNNNYRSRLARKIMDDNPNLDGFFELRSLRS